MFTIIDNLAYFVYNNIHYLNFVKIQYPKPQAIAIKALMQATIPIIP